MVIFESFDANDDSTPVASFGTPPSARQLRTFRGACQKALSLDPFTVCQTKTPVYDGPQGAFRTGGPAGFS